MSAPSALEKGCETHRSALDVRGWALLVLSFQTLGESMRIVRQTWRLIRARHHILRHRYFATIRAQRHLVADGACSLEGGRYRGTKRHYMVFDTTPTVQIRTHSHPDRSSLTTS